LSAIAAYSPLIFKVSAMVPTEVMPLVMLVIDKLREGRTLTAACRAAGITISTYRRHVSSAQELQDLHDQAVQESHDMMADALAEPFSHETYGETDPAKAAITSRNLQWLLARRAPKQYGDKSSIEITHRVDDALIAALEAGKQRALALPAALVIEDATFSEVSPEEDPEIRAMLYG
jgi:hypothetical protein